MNLPTPKPRPAYRPLVALMLAVLCLIPLDTWFLGIPVRIRIVVGLTALAFFVFFIRKEPPDFRRRFLALGLPLVLLMLAPVHTALDTPHILTLGSVFIAVLVLPSLLLRGSGIITFQFIPDKHHPVDIGYTLFSIFLAWGAFALYFGVLSPDVPFNWVLNREAPDAVEMFKLFMGINAVGIWDELFFINICFAILRSMYSLRVSNLAQAIIYTTVLCDMAFTHWGPVFVGFLAITQGYMYERSKALLWVLAVHLIVDYFLFQNIISAYYPDLSVWWHP